MPILRPMHGFPLLRGFPSRHRLSLAAMLLMAVPLRAQGPAPIIGRWDLTVQGPEGAYPSWLEVSASGFSALVGRFVGGAGSARPISQVAWANGTVRFSIPRQWERGTGELQLEGTLAGDRLSGSIRTPSGESHPFSAVRAPALRREGPETWGDPITLFDGTSLDAWVPIQGANQWRNVDGILTNTKSGGNLATRQSFTDFRLQLEFRYPKGGNSGIYLRGRHEVQVEDSGTQEPSSLHLGGIYGFLVPNELAGNGPGVWNRCEITLIGRRVTVVLNGKTVIADQTIPGITGGALDSNEGAPGPLFLQGDHTAVEFRQIIITPAKGK